MFRGHSIGGRLILPPEAAAYLGRYEDEPVTVEVMPVHSRRSIPQNRRLWLGYSRALKQAATLMPYDKEELHDALKHRSEVIPDAMLYLPNGEPLGISRSTKRLSVPRFGDYMEEVTATFARGGMDLFSDASS
jgi:hypothetical protein